MPGIRVTYTRCMSNSIYRTFRYDIQPYNTHCCWYDWTQSSVCHRLSCLAVFCFRYRLLNNTIKWIHTINSSRQKYTYIVHLLLLLFFHCFLPTSHSSSSPLLSLSLLLLVVTQIWGHIYTTRRSQASSPLYILRFVPCSKSREDFISSFFPRRLASNCITIYFSDRCVFCLTPDNN